MHRNGAVALGFALTFAAVGCGGGNAPTGAEFAKQVEAVCARTNARGESLLKTQLLQQRAQNLSSRQVHAMFSPRIVALKKQQLTRLEALAPPAELQATFVQLKRMLRQDIENELTIKDVSQAQVMRLAEFAHRRGELQTKLGVRGECS